MQHIIPFHDIADAADALLKHQFATVSLPPVAADSARRLVAFGGRFLRNVDPAALNPLDRKTMFPARLAGDPDTDRRVLQFFERKPKLLSSAPPMNASALTAEVSSMARLYADRMIAEFGRRDLYPDDYDNAFRDPAEWVFNIAHYPGLAGKNGVVRFPAHRDWGTLACYPAFDGLGLQFQIDGEWVTYDPPPGTMLVYAGQILTKASGGKIPALSHRVVQISEAGRSALIYYADARRDIVLPDGRTVGAFIDENLRKIKQLP